MSLLVGYGSSDEDEEKEEPGTHGTDNEVAALNQAIANERQKDHGERSATTSRAHTVSTVKFANSEDGTTTNNGSNAVVPNAGASANHAKTATELLTDVVNPMAGPIAGPSLEMPEDGRDSAPQSPYSATRSLMRDLTLPPFPTLEIPGSPPGSPDPAMEKKLEHFLELKKQGIHFNEKLSKSSMVKNPNLFTKLLQNAGLGEHDQYATTIYSKHIDLKRIPQRAYIEELDKLQDAAEKEEEAQEKKRDHIDFVSAAAGSSSQIVNSGSGFSKGLKGSAAERVMTELSKDRKRPAQISDQGSKKLNRKAG